MYLKIRYENGYQTIELDSKAMEELWVSLSLSSKLTAFRLQQLENKVAEHNNFARRIVNITKHV